MNTTKYITLDQALEVLDRQACYWAADYMELIPAADVRPVVHGKWVNDHNGKYSASGDNFYCSICKDPSLRAFGKPAKTNYCPNCGADMREET